MNIELNQKISAFVDGELNSVEDEKLLLKISKNPKLINKLNRYQMVNQSFKKDDVVLVNEGFLEKIKKEIEQEPHYFLPKQKEERGGFSGWEKTSVAIAASAVIATVLLSQKTEFPSNISGAYNSVIAQKIIKPVNPEPVVIATTQENEIKAELVITDGKEAKVVAETELSKGLKEIQQEFQHERLKSYLQAHTDNLYTYDSLDFQPQPQVQEISQD